MLLWHYVRLTHVNNQGQGANHISCGTPAHPDTIWSHLEGQLYLLLADCQLITMKREENLM